MTTSYSFVSISLTLLLWCCICCYTVLSIPAQKLISVDIIRTKSPFQQMLDSNMHPKRIEKMLMGWKNDVVNNDSVPLFRYLDNEFYGEALIGHPGQKFNVIFDTAFANSWVPSSLCHITDISCELHNKYNSGKSSTYKKDGRAIRIDFVDDYLSGILSTDLVHIGSKNVTSQTFAEMTHIPKMYALNKADGILGLAFKSISYLDVTPFLDNMVAQKSISKKMFSMYFNRDKASKKGGTLFLGGYEEKHFLGDITYVNLIAADYWRFEISSIHMKNSAENLCNGTCPTIIDTTSSVITGPSAIITKLNQLVQARPFIMGKFMVSCGKADMLPAVNFTIGDREFLFKSRDYVRKITVLGFSVCVTVFEANDLPSTFNNYWTLGASFMARYYTIFDAENKRVGFADVRM